jgi:hypothetical protein
MNFKGLLQIISQQQPESDLGRLVLDYLALKIKLENPEQQSWYFKKGIEGKAAELEKLKKRYNNLKDDFEQWSVDDILEEKIAAAADLNKFLKKGYINSIEAVGVYSLQNRIRYYDMLLGLKSKFTQLLTLEEYMTREDALLDLMKI